MLFKLFLSVCHKLEPLNLKSEANAEVPSICTLSFFFFKTINISLYLPLHKSILFYYFLLFIYNFSMNKKENNKTLKITRRKKVNKIEKNNKKYKKIQMK